MARPARQTVRAPAAALLLTCALTFNAAAAKVAAIETPKGPPPKVPRPNFMRHKPFLPELMLKDKREGWYFIVLPIIAFDQDKGVSLGALTEIYNNGKRSDAFFRSTAYRQKLFAGAEWGTRGFLKVAVRYDQPYLLDSPWRLRSEALIERQTGANYFGRGNEAMLPLTHPSSGQTYDSYSEFKQVLQRESAGETDARYDEYQQTRVRASTSAELDLLGGLLRPLVGLQLAHYWIGDYSGKDVDAKDGAGETVTAVQRTTRLQTDCAAGTILGCENGFDNFLKLGVTFDTRNFEPDPDSGVLAQLVGEISPGFLGSAETYFRLTSSLAGYYSLIPSITRLIAAGRVLYSMSFGDVPFYAQDIYALSVEDRYGVGGFATLRGFQQNRYVGRVGAVVNLELRWTFGGVVLLNQDLRFALVPFFETGRVFDQVDDFTFDAWQWSAGAGLKLAWNLSTVISFDFGKSAENTGFFMMFGHQF